MKVSLIAAVAENGTIGRNNDLPWRIREDMRHFVSKTKGHTVIMGRLNFDAMGRALPKRENIVVTRDATLQIAGCKTTTQITDALRIAEKMGESEAFVIGGAMIYALALPFAHCFYRTRVLAKVEGDIVFPPFSIDDWNVSVDRHCLADDENEHAFVIETLTRKSDPLSFG